jgi:hypothetical protein
MVYLVLLLVMNMDGHQLHAMDAAVQIQNGDGIESMESCIVMSTVKLFIQF